MLEVRQDRRNIILVNLFSVEAFKYTLGSLINDYGGARALFKRFEPRGENFYQDGGGKGPDLEVCRGGCQDEFS